MARLIRFLREPVTDGRLAAYAVAAGVLMLVLSFVVNVAFTAAGYAASDAPASAGLALPSFGLVAALIGISLSEGLIVALLLWVIQRRTGMTAWFIAAALVLGAALQFLAVKYLPDLVFGFAAWIVVVLLFAKASGAIRRYVKPAVAIAIANLVCNAGLATMAYLLGQRLFYLD